MLAQLKINHSDLYFPHFFDFLYFIKPIWIAVYNAYYGASLFLEQQKLRPGMGCMKLVEQCVPIAQKKISESPNKPEFVTWKFWCN